jgi:hypothetical protein
MNAITGSGAKYPNPGTHPCLLLPDRRWSNLAPQLHSPLHLKQNTIRSGPLNADHSCGTAVQCRSATDRSIRLT